MKNIKNITLLILLSIGIPATTMGQNISAQETTAQETTAQETTVQETTVQKTPVHLEHTEENRTDSIFSIPAPIPLASTMQRPFLMYGITPFAYDSYANWDLHKGFNASIGMNISVGIGKNRLHGVGFGQDAAFLYALPLNNRLSIAGGVYATNMDWGNYTYRNVGITGIAAFKATDRITIYGYGNKSLMPKHLYPAYPLPNFTPDKIGGMVNFKVGESASFSIGLEAIKNDHPYRYYW